MGGIGSGNYYRGSSQTTLEEMQRIDIASLNKSGFLNGHTRSGVWRWHCGDEPSGAVTLTTIDNQLMITGQRRNYGEDWEDFEQKINLLTTPCNYGGKRYWLQCPYCFNRVGVLALGGSLFACRRCYKVPYASQQESRPDRINRAQRKLAARMFEDEDRGIKKKGLHWKTFERLLHEHDRLENAFNNEMLEYCLSRGLVGEASLFGYRG